MASVSLWDGVREVLSIVKAHSEKNKPPKRRSTKLERLSGWAALLGGVIVVAGEVIRQVGDPRMPYLLQVYVSISILGLTVFAAGVIMGLVESVRSMRHPLAEHIGRITAVAEVERELFTAFERFEPIVLELACERLKLESKKVASRLTMIGGGEGLRTSLVGVAMLGVALVSKYEPLVHGWTLKSLAVFGAALLLGLSIGALYARYCASQADYYSDIIKLVLHLKSHVPKKPREPFSHRIRRGRRSNPRAFARAKNT